MKRELGFIVANLLLIILLQRRINVKSTSKILNLLTAFLAVIGMCSATLVCFIVIYTSINGNFTSKTYNSPKQTNTLEQANVVINNSPSEQPVASPNNNIIENDLLANSSDTDYTPVTTNVPVIDSTQPDFEIAFYGNENYLPEESNSEITGITAQTAEIQSTNDNYFNTYNNIAQQQTTNTYVLNTNPDRMKIHIPTCLYVKKIASENYSTSNLSIEELQREVWFK